MPIDAPCWLCLRTIYLLAARTILILSMTSSYVPFLGRKEKIVVATQET